MFMCIIVKKYSIFKKLNSVAAVSCFLSGFRSISHFGEFLSERAVLQSPHKINTERENDQLHF